AQRPCRRFGIEVEGAGLLGRAAGVRENQTHQHQGNREDHCRRTEAGAPHRAGPSRRTSTPVATKTAPESAARARPSAARKPPARSAGRVNDPSDTTGSMASPSFNAGWPAAPAFPPSTRTAFAEERAGFLTMGATGTGGKPRGGFAER